jgi:single-strand DNA-binding protein
MNKVTLLGNLTADPELKYTPKGKEVVEFTIAVTERWTTENGEKKESTYFGRCVIWGARGKAFADYHKKGQKALVEGRLRTDEWDDKETGKKRSATRILVDEWHFLTSAPKATSQPAQTQRAAPNPPATAKRDVPGDDDDDVPF